MRASSSPSAAVELEGDLGLCFPSEDPLSSSLLSLLLSLASMMAAVALDGCCFCVYVSLWLTTSVIG